MTRWVARIIGIVMLLVFAVMFMSMYNRLQQIQRAQKKPAATQTR